MKNVNSLAQESRDWAENLTQNIGKQAKLLNFWQNALEDAKKCSDVVCFIRWGYTKAQLKAKVEYLTKLYLIESNESI